MSGNSLDFRGPRCPPGKFLVTFADGREQVFDDWDEAIQVWLRWPERVVMPTEAVQ